jgi:hypothetical protein
MSGERGSDKIAQFAKKRQKIVAVPILASRSSFE